MINALRRFALVATSSLLSVGVLVVFFAWLALQVEWEIPNQIDLTGPSEIYAADGTLLARFTAEVDREEVPLSGISPMAQLAVITSEDARFYEHDGVDPISLLRAVVVNVRTGGITQGGSTLTQQFVKNSFEGVGSEQTLVRKVREAVISIQLERTLAKNEILVQYLNTVSFGPGVYGIEAAAQTYFGKPARFLTAAEGATLAQSLPAPSLRNPRDDAEGALIRRNRILERMEVLGHITDWQLEDGLATELSVLPRQSSSVLEPFFVDYVKAQIIEEYDEEVLLTGRLRIETTLDFATQRLLEESVEANLPADRAIREEKDRDGELVIRHYEAGAVAIDPKTGRVLGFYGGRDYDDLQVNLATQGFRQPGSNFKPITYIAALEAGRRPNQTINAPGSIALPDCGIARDKPIKNASGRGLGRITLESGLANSVNTVFAQLGCDVGTKALIDVADRLGVRSAIETDATIRMAIGGQPVGPTVLDMASAYATIANDGILCPAYTITRITGPDGEALETGFERNVSPYGFGRPRKPTQAQLDARPEGLGDRDGDGCFEMIDADIARTTTEALQRVVAETTGKRANINRPQAGKTGTTNDEADAWFTGYTPDLAMSVWVGERDSITPMRNLGGFSKVQGGTIPAKIWHDAALVLLKDVPPSAFLEPGEITFGSTEGGRRVGPSSPRWRPPPPPPPEPEPEPEPEPTATEPEPEPTATEPTEEPTDDPEIIDPEDPDDGGCFVVFC